MKVLYEDNNGNKVALINENYKPPKGELKYIFKGKNSTLLLGDNLKLVSCNFVLGDNCEISIGNNCFLRGKLFAAHPFSKINVGSHTKFNALCRLHAAEGKSITIGEHCLLSNVRFRTSDSHSIIDLNMNSRINHAKDIIIGDNVWIAEEVNIYKGVIIESGSVIGARSTVTKSLPGNSLCVGSPAVVVKSNISWDEALL